MTRPDGPPPIVQALPRRLVSRMMGRLGRVHVPGFLLRPLLRVYARSFGADLEEMGRPLAAYGSFLDFFTRPLRDGARPQDSDPAAVGAPADGRVQRTGVVARGTLLQVKGSAYGVGALLGSPEDGRHFEGGTYHVTYLAPGDYHRFHWPLSGRIHTVRHIPGDLWPVNERAVAGVDGLFVRNERVAALGRTANGSAFAFVAVGALNVGSIRLAFHPVTTNRGGRAEVRTWSVDAPGDRGGEFGRFEFGSTVVLLLAQNAGQLEELAPGTPVRVGQAIGRITATPT